MSTPDLYLSTKASVLNWIGKITQDATLFDFDGTAEEEGLEQVDLIGPLEFYMDSAETLISVGFKIAIVTHEDPQIQRLNKLMNAVANATRGKVVRAPILHHSTGNPIGFMTSNGNVLIAPVVRLPSKTRPLQTLALNFKMTLTS